MFFIKNTSNTEVIKTGITELESPELTEAQKRNFDVYAHSEDTDSVFIVSAIGWEKRELPAHDAENNKPAYLVTLCLKYTEVASLDSLKEALTKRLSGKQATLVSEQPDGTYTFFYELEQRIALPQRQVDAECLLELWKNAHGLNAIAGAVLDQDHFRKQLVEPSFIGMIHYREQVVFPMAKDNLFIRRLSDFNSYGELYFDTAKLLVSLQEAGWVWRSREDFRPGAVGTLASLDHAESRVIVTKAGFISLGDDVSFFAYNTILGEEKWAQILATRKADIFYDSYYYHELAGENFALTLGNSVRKCSWNEYTVCLMSLYELKLKEANYWREQVIVHKRVDGVRNYMYARHRLIHSDGKVYLNTSDVKLIRPNENAPSDRYSKSCPAISKLLNSLFGPKSDELEVFLTWLALAYQGAYYGCPQRGHAMYVVGAPGTGKSLLRELLGVIFGRSRSGQDYFCEASQFNAYALDDNPLVYLDDATVDWRRCAQMHNRIKELVATGEAFLNGKYEAHRHVEWYGRVFVTCNPAGEGRKLIPELEEDNKDKFIILKTGSQVLNDAQLGEKARGELAAFAHFLLHYRSPLMKREVRFGMDAFVSHSVREATIFRDGEGMLMECLERVLATTHGTPAVQDYTVSELYEKLSESAMVSGTPFGLCTAKNLGSKLSKIREAIESKVVSFPYELTTKRTSSRRSWVFTPRQ